MKGKRIEDGEFPENAGEYSKHLISQPDGSAVVAWLIKGPKGGPAFLIGNPNSDGSPYHWVQENEDGTITVQPNPPDAPIERRNSNSIVCKDFHGYIEHGVWREA